MAAMCPGVDFPVYGLPLGVDVPRRLTHLDGRIGDPPVGVWLWHGRGAGPTTADPWVWVGSLLRDRHAPPVAGSNRDPIREAAFAATFLLINATMPAPSDRPADYAREAVRFAERRADRYDQWLEVTWAVDHQPVPARAFSWAGAWAGLAPGVGGVDIVIVGSGQASGLELERVADSGPYGFDMARPFSFPSEVNDGPEDPGYWPWTADHATVSA